MSQFSNKNLNFRFYPLLANFSLRACLHTASLFYRRILKIKIYCTDILRLSANSQFFAYFPKLRVSCTEPLRAGAGRDNDPGAHCMGFRGAYHEALGLQGAHWLQRARGNVTEKSVCERLKTFFF